MRIDRDEMYMQMAELIAKRGTCVRRQVGCVLVSFDHRVLATGYNGVASGRPHCIDGHYCDGAFCKSGEGLNACQAIHAEQNAIALLRDPRVVGTAYVTTSPCDSCLKLLLGTSCQRIVCRTLYAQVKALDWWCEAGRELIHLGGEEE